MKLVVLCLPMRFIQKQMRSQAQAAKHGISTEGASIYVTLEPCLSCLKLIISTGIDEVFYETTCNSGNNAIVRDSFIKDGLVTLKQIHISEATAQKAANFLLNPISINR